MNLNRTIALVFAAFLPFAAFAEGQNRKTVVQEMVVGFAENDEVGVKPVDGVDDVSDNFRQTVATPTSEKISEPLPDYSKKQAVVITKCTSVPRGSRFEADILMLHADTKCSYKVYVAGVEVPDGRYSVKCQAVGKKTCKGFIVETDKNGRTKEFPFSFEYAVTEPVAIVTPKESGVLFAGVFNTVDVLVPGFSSSDIKLEVSNAVVLRKPSWFDIKPLIPGRPCIVSVFVRSGDEFLCMCNKEFRTLPLPRPSASLDLATIRFDGGKIDKDSLLAVQKVAAYLDSDLIEDVRYVVLGFNLKLADGKGGFKVLHSDSESFTAPMLKELKKAKPGTTFFVTDVAVKAPDQRMLKLSPMEVVVK